MAVFPSILMWIRRNMGHVYLYVKSMRNWLRTRRILLAGIKKQQYDAEIESALIEDIDSALKPRWFTVVGKA